MFFSIRSTQNRKIDSTTKTFLKVPIHNKGIEMINLSQILHSKPVKKSIPSFFQNQTLPTISYSYMKTTCIAGKILNFKQSIKDLDFEIGATNLSCDCHVSDFRYEPAGHVVTGNLGIIGSRKLRNYLAKAHHIESKITLTGTPTKKSSKMLLEHTKYSGQKRKK